MHSLLRKKLYFYISASLPLVMIAVTILVILESHIFVQYGIILLLIVFTIYNIYLFGHNNPIHITYDNEKIRIHYLFPRLNKTFYWREIHNMDLCQKAYMRMYGAKLPEMALIIKDKEQEVALWWNYYSKLNRIYLYWTTLKNRTSQEPIQSYKFNYQIFKKPLWSLLNFYLTMFFSFFSICFIYGVLPIFPILALTMGSFGLICSYYGLGQHLFYLEWDAQHLSIKNDLLPFLTYSIAWKDVRSIKFTTLYGDKSLWIADKEYNFKEYRIEAVPDKAIKGIYREMRKNDIPVENDIDN